MPREAKQVFAEKKGGAKPPFLCVGTWPTREVWVMLFQEKKFDFRLSEITSDGFPDKYLTTNVIC